MGTVDLTGVGDVESKNFLVPSGRYLCVCSKAKEKYTINGLHFINLGFEIKEGEFSGTWLWDRVFTEGNSEKGTEYCLQRLKLVRKHMGLPVDGVVNNDPNLFLGRAVYLTIDVKTLTDDDENTKKVNIVTFAGYDLAEQGEISPAAGEDAPF